MCFKTIRIPCFSCQRGRIMWWWKIIYFQIDSRKFLSFYKLSTSPQANNKKNAKNHRTCNSWSMGRHPLLCQPHYLMNNSKNTVLKAKIPFLPDRLLLFSLRYPHQLNPQKAHFHQFPSFMVKGGNSWILYILVIQSFRHQMFNGSASDSLSFIEVQSCVPVTKNVQIWGR